MTPCHNLERVDCPVCGPSPTTVWLDDGKPTRYVRCRNCGTVFACPRASRATRYKFLDDNYGLGIKAFAYTASRLVAFSVEAALIHRNVSSGIILDVGCDTGAFFQWFSSPNWQRYGVELISSAAAYAAETYDAQVYAGTIHQAAYPDRFFDLVTLMDMFYFVEDPNADLREIARILKRDGLLAIEFPGQAYQFLRSRGLLAWCIDRRWTRLLTDSAYLFWFRPSGLKRLLETNGFQVLSWYIVPSFNHANRILKVWSSVYYRALAKLAVRSFPLLTWAPKYLCLARLTEDVGSRERVLTTENSGKAVIRRGSEPDIDAIVLLHKKCILNVQLERIELDLLHAYYRELIRHPDCAVFVAVVAGRVVGYSAIVKSQRQVFVRLAARDLILLGRLVLGMCFSPRLYRRFFMRFAGEFLGAKWNDSFEDYRRAYELRAVAVDANHRRADIGTMLIQASQHHAQRQGWEQLIAWVAEDNVPSIRLFEKVGFKKVGTKIESRRAINLLLGAF